MGPEFSNFVRVLIYIHTLYIRAEKALVSLHNSAGLLSLRYSTVQNVPKSHMLAHIDSLKRKKLHFLRQPRGYKLFLVLNSTEHDISTTHRN